MGTHNSFICNSKKIADSLGVPRGEWIKTFGIDTNSGILLSRKMKQTIDTLSNKDQSQNNYAE